MSDPHPSMSMPPDEEFFQAKNSGPAVLVLGAVGVVAILGSIIVAFFNPAQFAFSWLFGFSFFFTIIVGALFWILLHHATDSAWSVVVRRQSENLASLAPWLLLFFIPIIFFAESQLYSWMRIPPNDQHLLDHKAGFLNQPFFWARSAFYFLFFSLASFIFLRLSSKQDVSGDVKLTFAMRRLTFASLPFFGVSITFAAIDWLMTLDYTWFSTMWGVYIFAGSALASMSTLILIIYALQQLGHLHGIVKDEHYHTMGKLLFAFSVFWAYIGFSQYMLIWYANIPEETSYFLRRNTESWNLVNHILVVGHFFIPFLLLLRRKVKKTASVLRMVAIWILIMHALDLYMVIMPILHPAGFSLSITDVLAPLGIGCILAALFLMKLGKVSLFPNRDPRIAESIALVN